MILPKILLTGYLCLLYGSGISSCLFANGKTRMEKAGSIIGTTFKYATIFLLLYWGKFYQGPL